MNIIYLTVSKDYQFSFSKTDSLNKRNIGAVQAAFVAL